MSSWVVEDVVSVVSVVSVGVSECVWVEKKIIYIYIYIYECVWCVCVMLVSVRIFCGVRIFLSVCMYE